MPSLQDALQQALAKSIPAPTPEINTMLNEWEQDEQTITQEKTMQTVQSVERGANREPGSRYFGVSNNVTRETFNYVRDNPGCTRVECTQALVKRGFKDNSVTSILGQLIVTGQLEKGENNTVRALIPEYRPIKAGEIQKIRDNAKNAVRMESLKKAWAARKANAAARKAAAQKATAAKKPAATVAQHIIAKEEPKQKYQPKDSAGIAALTPTTPTATPVPALPLVELTAEKILDSLGVRQAKVLYAELKKIFEE